MFWAVECADGDPDFFVCMNCLDDVYKRKIPRECPNCGAISAFEPFTLDSIKNWGTEELIAKARHASSEEQPLARTTTSEQMISPSTESSSV